MLWRAIFTHRTDSEGQPISIRTRIAAMESRSLCERMKELTAFMELEAAICVSGAA
jgi:hypothetical protein